MAGFIVKSILFHSGERLLAAGDIKTLPYLLKCGRLTLWLLSPCRETLLPIFHFPHLPFLHYRQVTITAKNIYESHPEQRPTLSLATESLGTVSMI